MNIYAIKWGQKVTLSKDFIDERGDIKQYDSTGQKFRSVAVID